MLNVSNQRSGKDRQVRPVALFEQRDSRWEEQRDGQMCENVQDICLLEQTTCGEREKNSKRSICSGSGVRFVAV